jgi:hypothetical protein
VKLPAEVPPGPVHRVGHQLAPAGVFFLGGRRRLRGRARPPPDDDPLEATAGALPPVLEPFSSERMGFGGASFAVGLVNRNST